MAGVLNETMDEAAIGAAVGVLSNLAVDRTTAAHLASLGAVDHLVELLAHEAPDLVLGALRAVAIVAAECTSCPLPVC